jgi:hypothetical protein
MVKALRTVVICEGCERRIDGVRVKLSHPNFLKGKTNCLQCVSAPGRIYTAAITASSIDDLLALSNDIPERSKRPAKSEQRMINPKPLKVKRVKDALLSVSEVSRLKRSSRRVVDRAWYL